MVNRPAGGARSKKHERAPYDWYCENDVPVRQLFEHPAINFGTDLIYDPCCGRGNILDVAKQFGHPTCGSDVVDRHPRHRFVRGNFISQITRPPSYRDRALSIVTNPPYGYEPDIAERIIRKAIDFPIRMAAFLLPIAFLGSGGRFLFFTKDIHPSHVAICSERPTMPPGHLMHEWGEKAFKGGMADYIWVIYTAPHRWKTQTIWLKPDDI